MDGHTAVKDIESKESDGPQIGDVGKVTEDDCCGLDNAVDIPGDTDVNQDCVDDEVEGDVEADETDAQGGAVEKVSGLEEADEYMYTKRDEFTSEIYKIQISNLPKRFGFAVSSLSLSFT